MTAEETQTTQAQTTTDAPAEAKADDKPAEQVDVRNLQDKFHGLLDQRNEFNDLAREARDARNLLNDQRREKAKEIEDQKTARDRKNEEMKKHKELRNSYQDQAKALIAQRKGKAGAIERSLPLRVRKLKGEIQAALERQETTVLGPAKEKELVDDVRRKRAELAQLEAELGKQKAANVDLSDTDAAIDELFSKADEEHEKVVAIQKVANEHHDKFVAAVKEVRTIASEADKKHQEFIALKTKADDYHNKAMELREKVMAVRGERAAEYAARRKEIGDINTRARQNISDPKAIEKANESALEQLKKGGKISFGF